MLKSQIKVSRIGDQPPFITWDIRRLASYIEYLNESLIYPFTTSSRVTPYDLYRAIHIKPYTDGEHAFILAVDIHI